MNVDDIQEEIDLNEQQRKAWKLLEKAVEACKKTNIYFYQNMATLGGLNGDNIETIICTEGSIDFDPSLDMPENSLNCLYFPSVDTACGFADDTHWVRLKDE